METTIPPMNVDISDLARRLADHVSLDKNTFGILSVLADVDLQGAPPAVNHQTQINDDDQQPGTGNNWCPSIIVCCVNIKTLVDTLKSTIPDFSFKLKNVNKFKSKLYLSDPKVHTSMMAILRTKNIHYFSFTRKEHKQQLFILRAWLLMLKSRQLKESLTLLFLTLSLLLNKTPTRGSCWFPSFQGSHWAMSQISMVCKIR